MSIGDLTPYRNAKIMVVNYGRTSTFTLTAIPHHDMSGMKLSGGPVLMDIVAFHYGRKIGKGEIRDNKGRGKGKGLKGQGE